MYDLSTLAGSPWDAGVVLPSRVAFVSRGYRSIDRERSVNRQAFGSRFPPLGLLHLARALREDATAGRVARPEVRIFDEESFGSVDELCEAVVTWADVPDRRGLVGITTYTHTLPEVEDFMARLPHRRLLLVAGGAHVTVSPAFDHAHLLARGEGRAALNHILNEFGTSSFMDGCEAVGICYAEDGIAHRVRPATDNSLETVGSPAFEYDLVAGERHLFSTHVERALGDRPQIYVCTQSCRARCSFCSTYLIHGASKSRPVDLIKEDLDYLVHDCGHDSLEFWDDDLLQHAQLAELLALLGTYGVPWFCFGRVDTIDGDVASALAAAGCRRIFLGIESMEQARLDYFNKGTTVDQNRAAVTALTNAGIGVIAGFIIGAPDDTISSIFASYASYREMPLHAISCSILTPDPGTREFVRAKRRGGEYMNVLGPDRRSVVPDIGRYGADHPAGLPAVCDAVSKAELVALAGLVEADFYVRAETVMRHRNGLPRSEVDRFEAFIGSLVDRSLQMQVGEYDERIQHMRAGVLDRAHELGLYPADTTA